MTDNNFDQGVQQDPTSLSSNQLDGPSSEVGAVPPAPPEPPVRGDSAAALWSDAPVNSSGAVHEPVSTGGMAENNEPGRRVIRVTSESTETKGRRKAGTKRARNSAVRKNAGSVSTPPEGGLSSVGRHGAGIAGANGYSGSRPDTVAVPDGSEQNVQGRASDASDEMEEDSYRLQTVDPLLNRPRISSIALCVVLAIAYFAGAAGVYWAGVHTPRGQNYDDMVWLVMRSHIPVWLSSVSALLSQEATVLVISIVLVAVAFIVMIVRKRWWLIAQGLAFGVICYGLSWLKRVLPRPMLVRVHSQPSNTAPSGHTLLAVAAVVLLLMAVPRVWRALVAVIGATYVVLVAVSLVAGRWHRPTDVVMSVLLACGLAFVAMALTRATGMDEPGKRASSASIQIVASVMITFGLLFALYGAFVIWNIMPGLDYSAMWANDGACSSTGIGIVALTTLSFGLLLAMRHITAAPLSKIGLIGAPPAPPSGEERQR